MLRQKTVQFLRSLGITSQRIQKLQDWLITHKRVVIIGSLVFAAMMVALVMAWPRTIVFAYGSSSCVSQPILLPGLMKSTGSDAFRLTAEDRSLGGLVAGKVCVIPTKIPQQGNSQLGLSPFGISWLGKSFTIQTENPPVASVRILAQPLPVSKPLLIPLDMQDATFEYKLKIDDKTLECPVVSQRITCDIPKASLAQGSEYSLELVRYFASQRVATVATQKVRTLTAVAVKESSITAKQTVYVKPKAMEVIFDKPITDAVATLVRVEGDKKTDVALKPLVESTKLQITWEAELARSSGYELRIDKVRAQDGSTLVDPFVMPFTTSGGPKVTGINIGKTKVPLGGTATLTFDQPLSDKQDITKAITATGGAAVTSRKDNQAFVSLSGVPKCADFTISVNDSLQSNFDVSGGSTWSHKARTICQTVGSIGVSARGRSITAYYFGNGPTAAIYTGAIHGSESSTRALMMRWIDDLEANPGNIPAGKSVVVVPAINPDGLAGGQRTNANNVDLNRNFATSDWKKDITTVNNAPFPGGGGTSSMSEPETKAIASLVAQRRPQLVLSYHSIGGVVIANQAGNSSSRAATYVSLSGYGNATGQSSTTFDYSISGTADDYYAEKLGVPSLVVELGSHTYHQFERNQKAMWAMLR